jgi:hypothetical protein
MGRKPKPEKSLTVVAQRRSGDCAVAALAGYLSLKYADVAAVAKHVVPDYADKGMEAREMLKIAKKLGYRLKRLKKWSLIDAVGIVDIDFLERDHGHMALLNRGLILDPFGSEAIPVDIYLRRERAALDALYVLKG